MTVVLYALALVASVHEGGAPLRSACDANAPTLATLTAGTTVDVKFSIRGSGAPCYKVALRDGSSGYLGIGEVVGIEAPKATATNAPVTLAALPPRAAPKLQMAFSLPKLPELKQPVELAGPQVRLHYDAAEVPSSTALHLGAYLNSEYGRVAGQLGCSSDQPLEAVAQSRASYAKSTAAADWSSAQFDGRVRIPVSPLPPGAAPAAELDSATRRSLTHELTHACLAQMGSWPQWVHEGMAQKIAGDSVAQGMKMKLAGLARQGKLPKLKALDKDWSGMDTEHAAAAYAESLAAVDLLYADYGQDGVRRLLADPAQFAALAPELDKRIAR